MDRGAKEATVPGITQTQQSTHTTQQNTVGAIIWQTPRKALCREPFTCCNERSGAISIMISDIPTSASVIFVLEEALSPRCNWCDLREVRGAMSHVYCKRWGFFNI